MGYAQPVDDETRDHLNRESAKHRERFKGLPGADRGLYYDRQGNPIGLGDWMALRGDDENANLEYIVVARTFFDSSLEVSTVWLGIDHDFGFTGLPLIFETMIFRHLDTPKLLTWPSGHQTAIERESVGLGDVDDLDGLYDFQQRYSTEEDALAGHRGVCAELERRGHVPVSAGVQSPTGD